MAGGTKTAKTHGQPDQVLEVKVKAVNAWCHTHDKGSFAIQFPAIDTDDHDSCWSCSSYLLILVSILFVNYKSHVKTKG
jgi:hypothetical protein